MARIKDEIVGKQFGDWNVLRYIGNSLWECQCSCGKIRSILRGKLTTGQTLSCGHNKLIDLIGKTFGEWKVLKYIGNSIWECQCSCGTVKAISSRHLRDGVSTNCGHSGNKKRIDLTGLKAGDWEVISYAGDKHWNCKCSCGNTAVIHGSRIRNGEIKSCGHKGKLKRIVADDIFGKLKVKEYISYGKYLCNCECGKTAIVRGTNLRSGSTTSCGCNRESIYTIEFIQNSITEYIKIKGETPFIQELAIEIGITYEYLIQLVKKYNIRDKFNTRFSSLPEKEIHDIIKGIDSEIKIEINTRDILKGKRELDLYIPSLKLAIEFNGNYWHNDTVVDKWYHQQKTMECARSGIRLIHIFEYEWNDTLTRQKLIQLLKREICIKEIATNIDIKRISNQDEKKFIEKYQLKSYIESDIAYGYYKDTELLSVLAFRLITKSEWLIVGQCTKDNIHINIKEALELFIENYNPHIINIRIDISKYYGNEYIQLGFQSLSGKITEPISNENEGLRVYNSGHLELTWKKQRGRNEWQTS